MGLSHGGRVELGLRPCGEWVTGVSRAGPEDRWGMMGEEKVKVDFKAYSLDWQVWGKMMDF